MRFEVLESESVPITEPDTNRKLGEEVGIRSGSAWSASKRNTVKSPETIRQLGSAEMATLLQGTATTEPSERTRRCSSLVRSSKPS
jgi:hypothetical protein